MEWTTIALIAVLIFGGLALLGFIAWVCMAVFIGRRFKDAGEELARDWSRTARWR